MIDSRIPGYEILNVIRVEDCIDEKHSVFTRYEAKHGRPDLLGQYFMILKLRIDPSRVHGSHIFRLQDWEITLVVSDVMKSSLESINNSGILFEEVG